MATSDHAIRYFHGGIPDLKPGQLITPHPPKVVDDCPICVARAAGQTAVIEGLGPVDPATARPDRVYITLDREYARFYASKYWQGDLYVVEPVGDLEPSVEDRFPSWTCEAARVRSVYQRCVLLTPKQRRALLKRWTAADLAAEAGAQ
ncbi:hypothetical protein AB0D11_02240 [Streptomyces monashensis]|uniref:hypothetical protein n=1 Tax=Streptomyces monashensis TaxID=1678012 RepID=UPI0033D2C703